jgi:hypothetical protein
LKTTVDVSGRVMVSVNVAGVAGVPLLVIVPVVRRTACPNGYAIDAPLLGCGDSGRHAAR